MNSIQNHMFGLALGLQTVTYFMVEGILMKKSLHFWTSISHKYFFLIDIIIHFVGDMIDSVTKMLFTLTEISEKVISEPGCNIMGEEEWLVDGRKKKKKYYLNSDFYYLFCLCVFS